MDSIIAQYDQLMLKTECCINIFHRFMSNDIDVIYKHIGPDPTRLSIDCTSTLYYPRGRILPESLDEALEKSVVLRHDKKNEIFYIYDPVVIVGTYEKFITPLNNVSYIIINPYIIGLFSVSILFIMYKLVQWTRSLFRVFM